MKNLIAVAAVLLAGFIVVGLVYGWIEYRQSEDKATIDIYTQEIKQDVNEAADKAVDAGRKAVEETGDALETAHGEKK